MAQRFALTDAQWERVGPLLPPDRGRRGRPAKDNRPMLDAVLWVLAAGVPWRDPPPRFGPWKSVHTRFSRWRDAGVFERALRALQEEAHATGDLDWSLHHVDSSVVRAHKSAAGAKKGAAIRPSGARGEAGGPGSTSAARARGARSPSC